LFNFPGYTSRRRRSSRRKRSPDEEEKLEEEEEEVWRRGGGAPIRLLPLRRDLETVPTPRRAAAAAADFLWFSVVISLFINPSVD